MYTHIHMSVYLYTEKETGKNICQNVNVVLSLGGKVIGSFKFLCFVYL